MLFSGGRALAAPAEAHVISVPAAKALLNYCLPGGVELIFGATDSAGPTGLAADGDLLGIECPQTGGSTEMVLVPYRESDGTVLDVALAEDWLLLSGQIVALAADEPSAWTSEFLEAMATVGPEGLRHLRVVQIGPETPPEAEEALARLAAQTPDVDAIMAEHLAACEDLLALFHPRLIVLKNAAAADLVRLADSGVRDLLITDAEDLDLTAIAGIPSLRSLVLFASSHDGTLRLPRRGSSLERLVVSADDLQAVTHLDAQGALRHLAITVLPERAMRQVARLPHLQGLVVGVADSEGPTSLAALADLRGLTWLGFRGPVGQPDVDRLIAANPGIEVLQFMDCETFTDFSSLRSLGHLRALLCPGSTGPEAGLLAELPHLRLLALGKDEFAPEQAGRLLGLQERMPEGRIAPVRGMCLGSGWLLLLVPLALAAMATFRALGNRRAAAR